MPGCGHAVSRLDGGGLYSERFADRFHSDEDAAGEARHVFLEGNRLAERLSGRDTFVVGELGFGAGLNFVETMKLWRNVRREGQTLDYLAVEAFPLGTDDLAHAHGGADSGQEVRRLLDVWREGELFRRRVAFDAATSLRVIVDDALASLQDHAFAADAWYLDGFSPDRNPDMWTADLMQEVFAHTRPGGTIATYTAAGHVRRALVAAGFQVERVPGHGRKRHMTVGRRPD